MIELEAILIPEAWLDHWRHRKSSWISESKQVKYYNEILPLLLEFEGAIAVDKLSETWKGHKSSNWKSDIGYMQQMFRGKIKFSTAFFTGYPGF